MLSHLACETSRMKTPTRIRASRASREAVKTQPQQMATIDLHEFESGA